MDCDFCGSIVFERTVTRRYVIWVDKKTWKSKGRWKGRRKIVVWTEEEKTVVCKACIKRAANESQRRDSPSTWAAYMKKNPEYLRQLSLPRRTEAWKMASAR